MKKQYIQPVLVVIELHYKTILMSGSNTLGVTSETLDADDALGRGSDYDFDDEDDF